MLERFTTLVACVGCLLGSVLFGQTTFRNPIITGMNPDPSICRAGDDYYLVTSTFEYFPGLPIYQSKDMVHWKMIGYALSKATNCPLMGASSGSGGNYAPTIRYHDSTFYVACTNYGGSGSQGQFYVTAKNPAGPWSDPVWVGNWNVDPSIMFENDSMYYLTPNNNDGFLLGTMNPKTGKYFKPLVKIALGTGASSPEGPHMYKIKDYYYLMSAEGGTGYQHMEVIQRSKSPWGPYEVSPINPVISHKDFPDNPFQAIGHADMVQLQDSSWWLVCLGFRPAGGNYHHLGRETFLAPVTWNANGWPKVGTDGMVKEEITAPNLSPYIWPKDSVRDNFDSTSLRLCWNFIRNPHAADWSLTDKTGYLRLKGSKFSFREKDSPAFIGRRQSAFNMLASVKVSFVPTATNEEAGLVVRGDDNNHYDLLVTKHAGKRVVMLRNILQGKIAGQYSKEIPDGELILRVSASNLQYRFWVQEEGKTAILMGTSATKDLSTETIGGFTGTYVGMYASGNGTSIVNPAYFDWVEYEDDPALPFTWYTGPVDSLNHMVAPVILATSSDSYDQAKIVWNNIANETGYIIERYGNDKFDSIGYTQANDTIFTDIGLTGNILYEYRIKAKNDMGYSYPSIAASVWTKPKPGPFFSTPAQIPGKIEAENYDFGIINEAWYDTDTENNGRRYRSEGVDVEDCGDTNNGYEIGWISDGEWVVYTVDVIDTLVNIQLRIASNNGGSITLELDGKEIAQTVIASTGGWQTWKTITLSNVKLIKGTNKKLKVTFVTAGFNFNWMNFVKVNVTAIHPVTNDGVSVYPNPANNSLTIKGTFKYEYIEIFNLEGKRLLSETTTYLPENVLHFTLPDGQYILSLNSPEQKKTVRFNIIR